jgi:hypothetical protein
MWMASAGQAAAALRASCARSAGGVSLSKDDAVVVALVEQVAGVEYALPGGHTFALVDSHFHVTAAL